MIEVLAAIIRGDCQDLDMAALEDAPGDLLPMAGRHGVAPLLAHHCGQCSRCAAIIAPIATQLERTLLQAAATEARNSADFARIADRLQSTGVDLLLIKGAAVAMTHYAAPYLRGRTDTDIFIKVRDIAPVRKVFGQAGYLLAGPFYKSHQFSCRGNQAGWWPAYDIHWRVSNEPQYALVFNWEEAWSRAVLVESESPGWRCHVLCPEHALLLACLHLGVENSRGNVRLIWLYDLFLVIARMSDQEISRFIDLAAARGVVGECGEAMRTAARYFPSVRWAQVFSPLAEAGRRQPAPRSPLAMHLRLIADDFRALPGSAAKLAMVKELLFPTGKELLVKYGKQGCWWLPPLYLRYLGEGLRRRMRPAR